MSEQPAGKRAGRVMMILAWAAAMVLATHYFGGWEDRRENPNGQPKSVRGDGYIEVRLLSGRSGHYLADGRIDGQDVSFMLDTGATAVAIPAGVAERLGLKRGAPIGLRTANGSTTGYRTRLASLELGEIRLADISAVIMPDMDGEILLGMSALKQLEFTQRDGTLVLRQFTQP
ncbi:retropepsin-like aspartic protease family protein [Pseudomonas sp. LRF_L74]|uniref:retropepsin-like aspartic protease family protein n=1 Tax=Pseudomonas sp. LRF_L74 TaxID=3369422 RepID=UPI003F60B0A2